jgi:hypothetical protein
MLPTVNIPIICRRALGAPLLLCCFIIFTPPTLALDKQALRRAITGPDRDVTDFVRDQVRRPVEVLDFLGIEAGMTVLDLSSNVQHPMLAHCQSRPHHRPLKLQPELALI